MLPAPRPPPVFALCVSAPRPTSRPTSLRICLPTLNLRHSLFNCVCRTDPIDWNGLRVLAYQARMCPVAYGALQKCRASVLCNRNTILTAENCEWVPCCWILRACFMADGRRIQSLRVCAPRCVCL